MHRKTPGIAITRTLGLSVSLLGVLLALALPAAPSAQAAGDASEAVCPNEANTGFSAALPDCRAYEQVSPPYKNGFPTEILASLGSGERVLASSLGLFGGASGTVNCPFQFYDFVRSVGGWRTEPVGAVPEQFTYAGSSCPPPLINNAGETMLLLHPTSHSVFEDDLYIPNSEGALVPVGPILPPSAVPAEPTGDRQQGLVGSRVYVATTASFAHTIFTVQPIEPPGKLPPGVNSLLWPGDTTILTHAENMTSLYEYSGVGNSSPALVGVANDRVLISDCGTFPGGYTGPPGQGPSGNHRHALSSDGDIIFFTSVGADVEACGPGPNRPPVNELYARLDGARTVAISEPDALLPTEMNVNCTGACIENVGTATEGVDWRDANFEGASANGELSFFTSTQQLLDGATQDPSEADSAYEEANGHGKGCSRTTEYGGCNLYVYNLAKPEGERLELISGGDSSGHGPEVQGVAGISEDGSVVYFVAKGELTKAPNEFGAGAVQGENNLYMHDVNTGETRFIATLAESDSRQWPSNGGGLEGRNPMDVTDDGRYLVFTSAGHLTPGDGGSVQQVFEYSAEANSLTRVSVGDEGFNADGVSDEGNTEVARSGSHLEGEIDFEEHPAVSEDGQVVVFLSSLALTPRAPNNKCIPEEGLACARFANNVYEYRGGHTYWVAGGAQGEPEVSTSGADIFLETSEALASSDIDSLPDIYDARVDGGFPAPTPLEPCSGEGCQGASPGQSQVFGAPGSATFAGPGNALVTPPAKPVLKPLSRSEKLTKALKVCRGKHAKKARTFCESAARRQYGPKTKRASHNGRAAR